MRDLILRDPDRLVITLVNQSRGNQIEKPPKKKGGGGGGWRERENNESRTPIVFNVHVCIVWEHKAGQFRKRKKKKKAGSKKEKRGYVRLQWLQYCMIHACMYTSFSLAFDWGKRR